MVYAQLDWVVLAFAAQPYIFILLLTNFSISRSADSKITSGSINDLFSRAIIMPFVKANLNLCVSLGATD